MEKTLSRPSINGSSAYRSYYPEKRRLSANDELCITILQRLLEAYPEISYSTIRKSLFQILKEDHYQLIYFDGHLSELTNRFYQIILNATEGKISKDGLDMFLCDLMYWIKEAFVSSLDKIQKNII